MDGLNDHVAGLSGDQSSPRRTFRDTSDFLGIQRGDELVLGGNCYLVTGHESEQGFGLDGEPKYWVKRGVDLHTQNEKIIKLVFFESLSSTVGGIPVVYYRSPRKEAEVLKMVRNHPHFMHGVSTQDSAGNEVRIIDRIRGVSLRKLVLEACCFSWTKLLPVSWLHDMSPRSSRCTVIRG